jgi:hypothetical protein
MIQINAVARLPPKERFLGWTPSRLGRRAGVWSVTAIPTPPPPAVL